MSLATAMSPIVTAHQSITIGIIWYNVASNHYESLAKAHQSVVNGQMSIATTMGSNGSAEDHIW